jgi:hypothetical protein
VAVAVLMRLPGIDLLFISLAGACTALPDSLHLQEMQVRILDGVSSDVAFDKFEAVRRFLNLGVAALIHTIRGIADTDVNKRIESDVLRLGIETLSPRPARGCELAGCAFVHLVDIRIESFGRLVVDS